MNIKGIELIRKAELNLNEYHKLNEFETCTEVIKAHCDKYSLDYIITSIYENEEAILDSLGKDLKIRKGSNKELLKGIYKELINKGLILKLNNNLIVDFREYSDSHNHDFIELEDAIKYWSIVENKTKTYDDSDVIDFLRSFINLETYYEAKVGEEYKYVWVGAFVDSDNKIKFNFSNMD